MEVGRWVDPMAPSKLEQAERLFRALAAREAELKANDEIVRKATFRSQSLRTAIKELRTTIATLIGDTSGEEVSAPLALTAPEGPQPQPETDPHPAALARPDGTIVARVAAYLEAEPRAFDATEIAQALGLGVNVVRTTLSKLHARGSIARRSPGEYCSVQYAHDIGAEAAPKPQRTVIEDMPVAQRRPRGN